MQVKNKKTPTFPLKNLDYAVLKKVKECSRIRINEYKRGICEMIISERVFYLLKEKNITQSEFGKRVGIANSTISDWKRKKTNPSADKIMDICNVLDVTPETLLTGKGIEQKEEDFDLQEGEITPTEKMLIADYHNMKEAQKKRLLAYVEALKQLESLEEIN